MTKTSGIIVGFLALQGNHFVMYTLPADFSQVESIEGHGPPIAICDRGCRGRRKIGLTSIEILESGRRAETTSDKRQARERFRRRAAIESIIGPLKNDHRMLRNYLKGQVGDSLNLFITCVAFNFRNFIRILCF